MEGQFGIDQKYMRRALEPCLDGYGKCSSQSNGWVRYCS